MNLFGWYVSSLRTADFCGKLGRGGGGGSNRVAYRSVSERAEGDFVEDLDRLLPSPADRDLFLSLPLCGAVLGRLMEDCLFPTLDSLARR